MSDGLDELAIPTDVYIPQGINVGDSERLLKMRFSSPHLDIVVKPFTESKVTVRYDLPDPGHPHPISELKSISEMLGFISRNNSQGPIQIHLDYDEKPLIKGTISTPMEFDSGIVEYVTAVTNAWKVLRFFDVPFNATVKVSELMRQKGSLMLATSLLTNEGSQLLIEFRLSGNWREGGHI